MRMAQEGADSLQRQRARSRYFIPLMVNGGGDGERDASRDSRGEENGRNHTPYRLIKVDCPCAFIEGRISLPRPLS